MSKVLTPEQFIISLKVMVLNFLTEEFEDELLSSQKSNILAAWLKLFDDIEILETIDRIDRSKFVDEIIDYLENIKPENLH